ncbi:MAG: endonuclease/exonuclease/phosphatase family protein [Elusimicrobiota bacterium]
MGVLDTVRLTEEQSRVVLALRRAALGASLLLCAGVSLCHVLQPDSCAAITVLPPWSWTVPGLALLLVGAWKPTLRLSIAVLAAWVGFAVFFMEESRSLLRLGAWPVPEWEAARAAGRAVRVVSLNCGSGSIDAAGEAVSLQPDILLLQEPPSCEGLERLTLKVFGPDGAVLCGIGASILARGQILSGEIPEPLGQNYAQARIRLRSGLEFEAVSMHLGPPAVWYGLWRAENWRAQTEHRRARREKLKEMMRGLESAAPLIVGGDFNSPGRDAVFRALKPRLRDAFSEAGRGWGKTAPNDTPLFRFDQVWVSAQWRPASVVALRTRRSDHRMVVCDLLGP